MEIECDEAIGEQIVSVPVTAVVVARRHLDGQIDDAQLFVYGDLCPHSRVARVLPGVLSALGGPLVLPVLGRVRVVPVGFRVANLPVAAVDDDL